MVGLHLTPTERWAVLKAKMLTITMHRLIACWALVSIIAGCSGKSGNEPGDGTGVGGAPMIDDCPVTLGGVDEPLFEQTPHRFRFYAGPTSMTFDGVVFDGPDLSLHAETDRQGACRLLEYEASPCAALCADQQVCLQGECRAYPSPISAGTLELRGVGANVTVEPTNSGHYYWSTEAVGYDSVESVGVSTGGDAAVAFDLETCLSGPPEPKEDWSLLLETRAVGEDVTLTWSNPAPRARIYLRMTTGIGSHGGISPVEVECEGLDTGTLTLPGPYLDALYAEGWSCGECGANSLLRYHAVESGSGSTAVQLRAESAAGFGFIP